MKKSERIKIIKEAFEQIGLTDVEPVKEDGKIIGWEMQGCTDDGIDMPLVLNLKHNKFVNALNFGDLINTFKFKIANTDIDIEIEDLLRLGKNFGLKPREVTEDVTSYYERLEMMADNFYLGFVNDEIVPHLKDSLNDPKYALHNVDIREFLFMQDLFSEPDYDPRTFGIDELNKLLLKNGSNEIAINSKEKDITISPKGYIDKGGKTTSKAEDLLKGEDKEK